MVPNGKRMEPARGKAVAHQMPDQQPPDFPILIFWIIPTFSSPASPLGQSLSGPQAHPVGKKGGGSLKERTWAVSFRAPSTPGGYRCFLSAVGRRGMPWRGIWPSTMLGVANGFYRRFRGPSEGSFFLPAGPTRRKSSSRRSRSTRATATRTTSPRRNWLPRSRPERLCAVRS